MLRRFSAHSALAAASCARFDGSAASKPPATSSTTPAAAPAAAAGAASGAPADGDLQRVATRDFSGKIPGASGPTNRGGIYSERTPEPYFVKEHPNYQAQLEARSVPKSEFATRSENLKLPEFETAFGNFERVPAFAGGPEAMRYQGFKAEALEQATQFKDTPVDSPLTDHHPEFIYTSNTLKKEMQIDGIATAANTLETGPAMRSLYRCCIRSLAMVKHFYYINMPLDQMRKQVRRRFEHNKLLNDPDAIKYIIAIGWQQYCEVASLRRTRASIGYFFPESDDMDTALDKWVEEEERMTEQNRFWNGEQQRREGPHERGHWSWQGAQTEREFEQLGSRVPRSWVTSKNVFTQFRPDGTHFWEKHLDYEGWYTMNVDPDTQQARKDAAAHMGAAYLQPRHFASKNRRAYRRLVKDIEMAISTPIEDVYTRAREQTFQFLVRDRHGEANRVAAERTLARQDDEFYSINHGPLDAAVRRVMREMPNPRLWKTDAFYFRLRHLLANLEFNWARVPVGAAQEKLFGEWVSDSANYAVLHSPVFAAVKADKARNPMAATYADFYTAFDPDVPETRRLPWYHADFNYDARYKWDERCMRMKRWVADGTVDSKHSFFDSHVAEWEQYVNRPERFVTSDSAERRYSAPRLVQLYRALNRVVDVALANQLRGALEAATGKTPAQLSAQSVEATQAALAKLDLSKFRFEVPVLIYPDGAPQPPLGLDGAPTGPIPTPEPEAQAPAPEAAAPAAAAEATA